MPLLTTERRRQILQAEGYDPDRSDLLDDGTVVPKPVNAPVTPAIVDKPSQQPAPSLFDTGRRAATENLVPTLGGAGAVGLGSVLAPALFSNPWTGIPAGIALAIGGSMATKSAQDAVTPDSVKESLFLRPQDIEANPKAAAIGGAASGLVLGNPVAGVRNLSNLGPGLSRALRNPMEAAAALTPAEKAVALNAAVGGGVSGAFNVKEQLDSQKEFSPTELAIALAGGTLFNDPWKKNPLNRVLGLHPIDESQVGYQGQQPARQDTPDQQARLLAAKLEQAKAAPPVKLSVDDVNKALGVTPMERPVTPMNAVEADKQGGAVIPITAPPRPLPEQTVGLTPYTQEQVNELATRNSAQAKQAKIAEVQASVNEQNRLLAVEEARAKQEAAKEKRLEQEQKLAETLYTEPAARAKFLEVIATHPEGATDATTQGIARMQADLIEKRVNDSDLAKNLAQEHRDLNDIKRYLKESNKDVYNPPSEKALTEQARRMYYEQRPEFRSRELTSYSLYDTLKNEQRQTQQKAYDEARMSGKDTSRFSQTTGEGYKLTPEDQRLATLRGVNLREDPTLPPNIAGEEYYPTRQVRINPESADATTVGHEIIGHTYLDDLSAMGGREAKMVEDIRKNYEKATNPTEFIADVLGNEQVRQSLKDKTLREKFEQWSQDIKDNWAYRRGDIGKAQNVIALKAQTDAPYVAGEAKVNVAGGVRHSTVSEREANRELMPSVSRAENRVINPIRRLGLQSEIESIRTDKDIPTQSKGKIADAFTKFYEQYDNIRGKLMDIVVHDVRNMLGLNPLGGNLKDYIKGNNASADRIVQYADALKYGEPAPFELTPKEMEIYKYIQAKVQDAARMRNERPGLREGSVTENYFPETISQKAREILTRKSTSIEAKRLANDYIEWQTAQRMKEDPKLSLDAARKDSEKDWLEYLSSLQPNKSTDLVKSFGPVDKAAGYGLPPSMRETTLLQRLESFMDRYSRRLAYHDAFETPEMQEMLFDPKKDNLSAHPKVKDLLERMSGIRSKEASTTEAVSGVVSSLVTGTLSAVRDIASTSLLGVQHQTPFQIPSTVIKGFAGVAKNWRESIEAGVNRQHIGVLEGMDSVDGLSSIVTYARRIREISNEVQLRSFGESLSRAMAFTQGKLLTLDNFKAYQSNPRLKGQQAKFFDDFAPSNWREEFRTGEMSPEMQQQIAARYVDSVAGTYDARSLPKFASSSTLAPFLQLSRWSIGKAGNFTRFVIEPALKGNFTPLLNQTLVAGLFGGLFTEALNEYLNGRKSKLPTFKEIEVTDKMGGESGQALAYKLVGLAALGGYAGELSNLARMVMDKSRGNKVQTYNYLAIDAANNARMFVPGIADALLEGDLNKFADLANDLVSAQSQTYRALARFASEETAQAIVKSNKQRDLTNFKQNMGMPIPAQGLFEKDPDKYYQSKFRGIGLDNLNSSDVGGSLTKAIEEIMQGEGTYEDKKQQIQALKSGAANYFPLPENQPLAAGLYSQYLSESQSPEVMGKRYADQLAEREIMKAKNSVVPSLR